MKIFFITVAIFSMSCAADGSDGIRTPGDANPPDSSLSPNGMDSGVGGGVRDAGSAAVSDASQSPPPSPPEADESPSANFSEADDARSDPTFQSRASCYDGVDNDLTGKIDCEDPNCAPLRSCCVGNGDCCSPNSIDGFINSTNFLLCTDLDSCFASTPWSSFGMGVERTDRGLVSQGTATEEGGVRFHTPIDLQTTRLQLNLDIDLPGDCDANCIETLTLGLVEDADADPGQVLDFPIALTYSGARDAFSLFFQGRERNRFSRGEATNAELIVRPTGSIQLRIGSEIVARYENVFSPRYFQLVLSGRSRDGGQTSLALKTLNVLTSLCDIPTAWTNRAILDLSGTDPSIEHANEETRIAYLATDGSLRFVREIEGRLEALPFQLDPTSLPGVKRLADPELFFRDGVWQFYFTAIRDDGQTEIRRGTFGEDSVSAEETVLTNAQAPTVAWSPSGVEVMVVLQDEKLVAYLRHRGTLQPVPNSMLAAVVQNETNQVGKPSLVLHNRAWHLYVPLRRGTRWTLELFASDEMVAWRHVGTAMAGEDGFDRLGILDPDAESIGDEVRLLYVGDDGVTQRLGQTRRMGTRNGEL